MTAPSTVETWLEAVLQRQRRRERDRELRAELQRRRDYGHPARHATKLNHPQRKESK